MNKAQVLADSKEGDMRRSVLAEGSLVWVEDQVNGAIEEKAGDEDVGFTFGWCLSNPHLLEAPYSHSLSTILETHPRSYTQYLRLPVFYAP
jgi:hypothetical protein